MIVFGDLAATAPARAALENHIAKFRAAMSEDVGLTRHAALVRAYIEASGIAQGCVDAQFRQMGADSLTPLHIASIEALRAMARVILMSWRSEFHETGVIANAALDALIARTPDESVAARVAEGFAFYALYPEGCFAAWANGESECVVIGVRSIGMALAPLLAQALEARFCFTVRPTGHPFARECRFAPDLSETVRARRNARFCIIDEGPGLSGSSFMAVADAFESLGVARERIEFFASNPAGPGAAAAQATQERWRAARKHILDSEAAIGHALAPYEIVRDMSGGLWRLGHANAAAPANRPYERRKFLVESRDGQWLATFAGLGAIGEEKARIARALSAAGFTPRTRAARHGFLLQRWIGGARPLEYAPREQVVARVCDYIAFRAKTLAAPPTGGASIEDLFAMTRHNCGAGADADVAAVVKRFAPMLAGLARTERPIASDNRMHAWEWIVDNDGAILKCDAVDHCAGHDLIGCRDAAWDVAGAIVEFSFVAEERAKALARLEAHGVDITPVLLEFFILAYCAFQLGAACMAADANAPWPDDAQRWRAQAEKYRTALRAFAKQTS